MGTSSKMAGWMHQVFVLLLFADVIRGQGTTRNPVITDYSVVNKRPISESLAKDSYLGTVEAFDPEGGNLEYSISGPAYSIIAIDKFSGNVTLIADLDFENRQTRSLTLTLTVSAGRRSTSVDGSVIIEDENDNDPDFTFKAPSTSLSEDEKPVRDVLPVIVTDRDNKNEILQVTCLSLTERQRDACRTFGLRTISRSNRQWEGQLQLIGDLDYEQRKSYVVILQADDGARNVTNQITILVEDVNDSPPVWERTGPKVIDEEEPIGTLIQAVTAVDPDEDAVERSIRYELMTFNDVFYINETTGEIRNAIRLDYDAPNSRRNVPYDLKIKARELIILPNGQEELGDDPFTTATVDIKITVRDINDNKPVFYRGDQVVTNYEATINENIANGESVPSLQISVEDNDESDVFNTFKLRLDRFNDVFGIVPDEDTSSTSPSIFVKDASRIDYETGPKAYIFEIIATESRTTPAFTSTATVTINVRDINDETPRFDQRVYTVNVSEEARGGRVLLRLNAEDPEDGPFGKAGIRYSLTSGNNPEHFALDPVTGVLTVKDCATPGKGDCINYERKKRYDLRVEATDDRGNGETGSAQVIVNILDENDNVPVVDSEYLRYIRELQTVTINPLIVRAKDDDEVGGPLSYRLFGRDSTYFQITLIEQDGETAANITAVNPVKSEDAFKPNLGEDVFNFTLVVSDQSSSATARIIIRVIDTNNYAPHFLSASYRQTLPEGSPGEKSLVRVSARDFDSPTTGNGIIDFVIVSGSFGKFQLKNRGNQSNGETFYVDVFTNQDAEFDFLGTNPYNLTLQCRDRGTPSLTGTASVLIYITDINNVDPVITPTSTTINVREDTPIGRSVHKVIAVDPDAQRNLRYFMTAVRATQPNGANASVPFRNLFIVNSQTGDVTVNGPLNRDDVAFIINDLRVEDQGSNPFQIGTGALFIRITEYNDQDPVFSQPLYNVTLPEERVRNAYVVNLECTDEDDRIASYSIRQISPRFPQYFSLLPGTGMVLVNDRIDFERIERITLQATCTDTGQNPRTATSSIIVNVENLNDNAPVFVTDPYSKQVDEKLYVQETELLRVSATDIDKGDFGVVRYEIEQGTAKFRIDSVSGQIFIKAGAEFDRENPVQDDLVVIAYDSPNNPGVRRQTSVPVYITVADINDNCPVFKLDVYKGVVPESADPGTNIVDIYATDKDIGNNAKLYFRILPDSGVPIGSENLFLIQTKDGYGRLLTDKSLRDKVGIKRFNVTATDMDGSNNTMACTTVVPVEVDVKDSQNDAPEWIRPPRRNFVIYVLESQYRGMLVYDAKAKDENEGPNGVVDYYFSDDSRARFVSSTPEFRINRVTGVIRAEVVFDREQTDKYFLTLMARDRGNPSSSSETTLTVVILDVDDNDPKFPMKNGFVVPLILPDANSGPVRDDEQITSPDGKLLGNCSYLAKDADSDVKNNRIYYRLLTTGNGIEDYIRVNRSDCRIYLLKGVNYEDFSQLEFDILAFNEKNDDSVKRYKREVNPSILPVVVSITDDNDNPPVFTEETYLACASVNAPYQATILEVSATDPDAGDAASIRYALLGTQDNFGIDENFGTIYNKISFRYNSNPVTKYTLNVEASDSGSQTDTATAIIFIADSSNLVRIKVNRPRSDVEPFRQQLVTAIKDNSRDQIAFACIDSIANHRTDDGDETQDATDVFLLGARRTGVAGNDYSVIPADQLADIIAGIMGDVSDPLSAVYVTKVEKKGESGGFELTEDAILAILIICILLIFLAIILLCLACYCIRNSKRKKVKKLNANRHTVPVAHEPVETSFNPVYSSGPDGTEYATVKKTPITPVVVPMPAPQDLQPMPTEQPTHLEPAEPQPEKPFEPEEPEPVIETEVLPEPGPAYNEPRPQPLEHPEYEDPIETTILDDETPHHPPVSEPVPEPEPVLEPPQVEEPTPSHVPAHDGDIEVEIKDTPPASPAGSRKGVD